MHFIKIHIMPICGTDMGYGNGMEVEKKPIYGKDMAYGKSMVPLDQYLFLNKRV